ncbi:MULTISPECIES: alpha/beta hydrolase [unclassified Streptomyces]|uniref:alpha/beta hydrolase n=1 Tax=unclassified Streptomyces TaxID=2593676 RepID=UPI000F6C2A8A|nr:MULTISPECIES: alpha/beta hydrolase [unclassified Streptomyces]AZM59370.1 proteinase [Streptomyces sp. WAC 01438]RSM94125.1 proteinase [Streptomyces sp. WAC 01420]
MPRRPATAAAALVSGAVLLSVSLAACGHTGEGSAGGGGGGGGEGNDRGRIWTQSLNWKDCPAPSPLQGGGEAPEPLPDGTAWQCATMKSPLDWDKPAGETIDVVLIRARSGADAGDRIGSLLFNFGGPGESGVTTLPALAADYEKLRTRYDLVGFDPRGVGASNGVTCLDTEARQEMAEQDDTPDDGDDEVRAVLETKKRYAAACARESGRMLPHVGTEDAARDMELMRHLLGDDKLHYFGISYGTELGGVYAHLFPRHVGRAVLDGVVDPTLDQMEQALAQAGGFQLAFEHFAQWCVRTGCGLGDSVDEVQSLVMELEAALDDDPLTLDGDRVLTGSLLLDAVVQALYAETAWPALAVGLGLLADDEGQTLLNLADALGDRHAGGYSDQQDAQTAITCADRSDRYTVDDVLEMAPAFEEASPLFGDTLVWGALECTDWPVPGKAAHPDVRAPGAPPVLLVGNTGDPATPYAGAARMAERLGKGVGVELTYRGEGHGAYDSGNTCVRDAVDAYLLAGEVPAAGSVCAHEPPAGKQ